MSAVDQKNGGSRDDWRVMKRELERNGKWTDWFRTKQMLIFSEGGKKWYMSPLRNVEIKLIPALPPIGDPRFSQRSLTSAYTKLGCSQYCKKFRRFESSKFSKLGYYLYSNPCRAIFGPCSWHALSMSKSWLSLRNACSLQTALF